MGSLLAVISLAALFADVLTTADPQELSIRDRFEPPSMEFVFGTDNFGRSQWARVLYGARLSLLIGLGVVLLNAVFGTLVGAAVVGGGTGREDQPQNREEREEPQIPCHVELPP